MVKGLNYSSIGRMTLWAVRGVRQLKFCGSERPHRINLLWLVGPEFSDGLWCHAQGTELGERSRDRASPQFVDDDYAGHSSSRLIFFDRYFSREVKQAGAAAARAPRKNGAD